MRHSTGQKQRIWTEARNRALIAKMDPHHTGRVSQEEFVRYFAASLPKPREEFAEVIAEFQAVASQCGAATAVGDLRAHGEAELREVRRELAAMRRELQEEREARVEEERHAHEIETSLRGQLAATEAPPPRPLPLAAPPLPRGPHGVI
jgi:uncharacterized protein with von Willebrand factor type A (vWA) domain